MNPNIKEKVLMEEWKTWQRWAMGIGAGLLMLGIFVEVAIRSAIN